MAYEDLARIKGVKLQGGRFDKKQNLFFFKRDLSANRLCVVFGCNGSGKSSVAEAYRIAAGGEKLRLNSAQLIDGDGNEAVLSEDERRHLHVFDEAFTDSNVRLKVEGLETVALLGSQVQFDTALQTTQEVLDHLNEKIAQLETELSAFHDKRNTNSAEYFIERCKSTLATGWAERDKEITAKVQKRPISKDVLNVIGHMSDALDATEVDNELIRLNGDYAKQRDEIKEFERRGTRPVDVKAPEYREKTDDDSIRALLAAKLQSSKLDDREQDLVRLCATLDGGGLERSVRYFSSKPGLCPFCLQQVTPQHVLRLQDLLTKYLDRQASDHRKALQGARMAVPEKPEWNVFLAVADRGGDGAALAQAAENCEAAYARLVSEISKLNKVLEQKLNDLFTPVEWPGGVRQAQEDYAHALEALEDARLKFNERQPDLRKMRDNALKTSKELAAVEIKKDRDEQMRIATLVGAEERKLATLQSAHKGALKRQERYRRKMADEQVAVEIINSDLGFVLGSADRLQILYRDGHYLLESRGKPVTPAEISTGERNAIALCYFFAAALNGERKKESICTPHLFVIDDPVSSFDQDNRVGMLSLLNSKLSDYLIGCRDSKALVLTHDLQLAVEIAKCGRGIANRCARKFSDAKKKFCSLVELTGTGVEDGASLSENAYAQMLELVYEYACGGNKDGLELVIGNMTRRLCEAFTTFYFGMGIDEMLQEEDIEQRLGKSAPYFQRRLLRLVLNLDSHSEDTVKFSMTGPANPLTDQEERRRTVQDVLCLMYVVDPLHLKLHLGAQGEEACGKIEEWLQERRGKEELTA